MDAGEFSVKVEGLQQAIDDAMERFFQEHQLAFDAQRFHQETSVDLRQLALEAHFYGCNAYPDID